MLVIPKSQGSTFARGWGDPFWARAGIFRCIKLAEGGDFPVYKVSRGRGLSGVESKPGQVPGFYIMYIQTYTKNNVNCPSIKILLQHVGDRKVIEIMRKLSKLMQNDKNMCVIFQ